MADIDLSKLGTDEDPREIFDFEGLSKEQQEELQRMAEEHEAEQAEEGQKVTTAFLVVVGEDGTTVAIPDLDYAVVRDRIPSTDDIYGAVSKIAKDITVQETAQITLDLQMAVARQQAQRMQEAQMAKHLNIPGSKQ